MGNSTNEEAQTDSSIPGKPSLLSYLSLDSRLD